MEGRLAGGGYTGGGLAPGGVEYFGGDGGGGEEGPFWIVQAWPLMEKDVGTTFDDFEVTNKPMLTVLAELACRICQDSPATPEMTPLVMDVRSKFHCCSDET